MGNSVSCQYSSSGNASSACNTYASSDAQLTTGAIVGIVIGSLTAVILLIVVVIVILRVLSRRYPIVNPNPQPYIVHDPPRQFQQYPPPHPRPQPQPYPQPSPVYTSSDPPPYSEKNDNNYKN